MNLRNDQSIKDSFGLEIHISQVRVGKPVASPVILRFISGMTKSPIIKYRQDMIFMERPTVKNGRSQWLGSNQRSLQPTFVSQ